MNLFFINLMMILGLPLLMPASANGRLPQKQNPYLLTVMGYLMLLAALRAPSVGTDTASYLSIFRRIGQTENLRGFLETTSLEKGFVLLNALLYRICPKGQVLLIAVSVFSFGSVTRFFRKHSQTPWMSVYLFFCLQIFDFFLSGMRQTLAIACLLYAYDAVLDRRPVPFLIWTILAGAFHTSGLIFLSAYPISKIRSTKNFLFFSAIFGLLTMALWQYLLPLVLTIFPKYQYYSGDSEFSSGGITGVLLKASVYLTVILVGEFLEERKMLQEKTLAETMELRLVWILILISMVAASASVFARLYRYFEIILCIYLPNSLNQRKMDDNRKYMTILLVFAFGIYALVIQLLRTPQWQTTYPYSFFWNETKGIQ